MRMLPQPVPQAWRRTSHRQALMLSGLHAANSSTVEGAQAHLLSSARTTYETLKTLATEAPRTTPRADAGVLAAAAESVRRLWSSPIGGARPATDVTAAVAAGSEAVDATAELPTSQEVLSAAAPPALADRAAFQEKLRKKMEEMRAARLAAAAGAH